VKRSEAYDRLFILVLCAFIVGLSWVKMPSIANIMLGFIGGLGAAYIERRAEARRKARKG
jgi:hypothetical protein